MAVPETIQPLVDKYTFHRDAYIRGQEKYNEAQLRQDFTDPFFHALGWDVNNNKGHSEAYREVMHGEPIRIRGTTFFFDYTFRIGGIRKFIVETKKPSVRIKDDADSALQLRRYAWNAKLPLSILTNFEEFAIYDCTIKPEHGDTAAKGRIEYFSYNEIPAKWEYLVSVFAQDSILKGSFDKYAGSQKGKKGTATVDDDILTEIESWRDALAKNIAIRNPTLSVDELNTVVQRTIDRLLFLRICEDRGIEEYTTLHKLLEGEHVYARLCDHFRQADAKYNSGLFHFEKEPDWNEMPDTLSLSLTIDDKVLKGIIKRLYYPETPYLFSVIPPEILGHVYEQFLGKVIRLTDGHQAKVEYKPEVKKAGGVFYTPQYIVEYIVKHTVGELVKEKTPRDVAKLRVLDPACGSGSFLIGAYQFLLDWHRDWYIENLVPIFIDKRSVADPAVLALLPEATPRGKKHLAQIELPIYRAGTSGDATRTRSDWRLTTVEKKRILLNNIFGVDIDQQAVEVTKLALLLKVLEEENEENIDKQLKLFAERALPSLHQNIKCGNSLIGTDILTPEMPSDEVKRINPFDWDREFAPIMVAGGFDAVIGNPPWGAGFTENELKYLRKNYSEVIDRMIDSYIYFIPLSIRIVKRKNPIGLIIPSTILNQVDTTSARKILLNRGISDLISLGQGIFTKKVLNTSTILITESLMSINDFILSDLSNITLEEKSIVLNTPKEKQNWKKWKEFVQNDPHFTFFVNRIDNTELLDQLRKQHISLENIIDGAIQRGVSPDVKEAHIISKHDAKKMGLENDLLRDSISGSQIKRYQSWKSDQLIIYTTKNTKIHDYPKIENYLKQFKDLNTCGEVTERKHPYWALHRPRDQNIFKSPKFIGLTTSKKIELIYDDFSSLYVTDAMYVFSIKQNVNPWALMAVLHSKLFLFLYRVANQGESRVIPQVKASKLYSLPIPKSIISDDKRVLPLIQYCTKIIELNKKLQDATLDHEKTLLSRQVEAADGAIDTLVYELYGLTAEEIAIVEGSAK